MIPTRDRILVSGFWAFADAWFTQAFSLAVFLLLARLLDPVDFGIVAMAAVFTDLMADLVMAGGNRVLVQRERLERSHVDVVFTMVLIAVALGAVLLNVAAPLLASLYGVPEIAPIVRWLSLSFVLTGLSVVPIALLSREMRFASLGARSLVATSVGGVVGIAMALQGAGAYAIVGQSLANGAVGLAMLAFAVRWRPRLSLSRSHIRDVGGFALSDIGARVVGVLYEKTLPFVVGIVLGPTVVGYLNLAWRIMNMPARLLIGPVGSVLMPSLSRVQHDPVRLAAFFREATALSAFMAYPAFLGLAAIAPELVVLAAGEKWLPAAVVLQMQALFSLMRPPSEYGKALLFAIGRPRRVLDITVVSAVLHLVLVTALAPFGLLAAVTGTVVVQAVSVVLIVRAILPPTGLDTGAVLAQVLPSLVAAGGMALAVAAWLRALDGAGLPDAAALASAIALGVLVYGALSLAINRRQLLRAAALAGGLLGKLRPSAGR